MKGISTIIATILMVVITIGLISVAYLYMSGLITGSTAQNIALMDAYCDAGTNTINMLIRNDGTTSITFSNVKFYLDGTVFTAAPTPACTTSTLNAGSTQTCSNSTTTAITDGFHELRVVGPSNAVGGSIQC
jgi:FlaG/FlaF family flagellin (archaellin)